MAERTYSEQGLRAAEPGFAQLKWGLAAGWFGDCVLAWSEAGLCWLDLSPRIDSDSHIESALQRDWPASHLQRDDPEARHFAALVFSQRPSVPPLHLHGTDFQLRVWNKLMQIPAGETITYGQLAVELKLPRRAARAVGGAVAANRLAIVVPCHRVVPASGGIGGFRWGPELKRRLLDRELARISDQAA